MRIYLHFSHIQTFSISPYSILSAFNPFNFPSTAPINNKRIALAKMNTINKQARTMKTILWRFLLLNNIMFSLYAYKSLSFMIIFCIMKRVKSQRRIQTDYYSIRYCVLSETLKHSFRI